MDDYGGSHGNEKGTNECCAACTKDMIDQRINSTVYVKVVKRTYEFASGC